eukprot:SAG25_NODE_62_length_17948_cov_8.453975_1_plen_132_part_00
MGVYTCIRVRFVWGLIWRSESSEHPIFTGNPLQAWKKLNKNKFLNKNMNFVLEQQNSGQNQGASSRNPGKFRSRTLKSDHISLTSLPYFFLKIGQNMISVFIISLPEGLKESSTLYSQLYIMLQGCPDSSA